MSEVKIVERIVVDEPQYVEIAIFNMTGKRVDFELIRKFIINEKNTMFYLDRKLNSSTEPGYYTDYLWLDTGFRDDYNNSIMICLHNGYNGYVGHYTGSIKQLTDRVKSSNKKNQRDIDKNLSRFIAKYKSRVEERDILFIDVPREYAVATVNKDTVERRETALSMALKNAGIEIKEVVEEHEEEAATEKIVEEFTEFQNEITIGILLDQMESMQGYIDELLAHVENNEKTSQEEIGALKAQNQEYKRALVNIRMFNAENEKDENLSEEEQLMGHNFLGKNEKILVLGNTDIRVAEMRAIARDYYGFEKTDFEFITDYDKIKTAGSRIHGSDRYVAIIFGNCPHKVAGIGNYKSIIDEYKQREDCPISIDARTEAGGLKITKQSFRSALTRVYMELKASKAA